LDLIAPSQQSREPGLYSIRTHLCDRFGPAWHFRDLASIALCSSSSAGESPETWRFLSKRRPPFQTAAATLLDPDGDKRAFNASEIVILTSPVIELPFATQQFEGRLNGAVWLRSSINSGTSGVVVQQTPSLEISREFLRYFEHGLFNVTPGPAFVGLERRNHRMGRAVEVLGRMPAG